jgi:methyltransferase (TIGR00027 family)
VTDTSSEPDSSAVRVALWRALHTLVDPPPHVLVDDLGLRLANPDDGWQQRRDMHPQTTSRNRASIVARARYTEDLVESLVDGGLTQYVILGAGLDTFAQRHRKLLERLDVYEVDQPATQAWKEQRLRTLGLDMPTSLHFVPVDFERGDSWIDGLTTADFDPTAATLVASLGVAVYLGRPSIEETLRAVASFSASSTLVMSYMIPLDHVDADERGALDGAARGARASGTPWISFFTPDQIADLAHATGFTHIHHVPPAALAERYFASRTDGLRPSSAEHLVVASS